MRSPQTTRIVQLILAFFILIPLLCGLFWIDSNPQAAGLYNSRILLEAMMRSGWIGLGTMFIALLLGLPGAWFLASCRQPYLWLTLSLLPLALAPSALVSGWVYWLAPSTINSAFASLGTSNALQPQGLPFLFSEWGVILLLGLSLWPVVLLESWPAFTRLRDESYAAALCCGSSRRAFWKAIVPQASGEIASGALIVFLLACCEFVVPSLLLVRTLSIEISDLVGLGGYRSAFWAGLPFILLSLLTIGLLALGQRRLHGSIREYRPEMAQGFPIYTQKRFIGSFWLLLAVGLGFVLPMLGCGLGAIVGGKSIWSGIVSGKTELLNSLRLALVAGIVTLLLGLLRILFWPRQSMGLVLWAALLLMILPGALISGGMLAGKLQTLGFLDRFGELGTQLDRSLPAGILLCLGYTLRFLYLPLRLLDEGMRHLDPATFEAAQLAGHGRLSTAAGAILPQLHRHLLAAGMLVFVLALGELAISARLASPGAIPASLGIFNQQHYGYQEGVFGQCLALGILSSLGLGLALLMFSQWQKRLRKFAW